VRRTSSPPGPPPGGRWDAEKLNSAPIGHFGLSDSHLAFTEPKALALAVGSSDWEKSLCSRTVFDLLDPGDAKALQ
jgi:hypothetical protein